MAAAAMVEAAMAGTVMAAASMVAASRSHDRSWRACSRASWRCSGRHFITLSRSIFRQDVIVYK
eukprot:scaffold20578_cov124-Isochrysis_galbana.AAC.3